MTTIAFIGLGNMGNPMAANLVKAGHRVQGFDLMPENVSIARDNGVIAESDARGVAATSTAFQITVEASARQVRMRSPSSRSTCETQMTSDVTGRNARSSHR